MRFEIKSKLIRYKYTEKLFQMISTTGEKLTPTVVRMCGRMESRLVLDKQRKVHT